MPVLNIFSSELLANHWITQVQYSSYSSDLVHCSMSFPNWKLILRIIFEGVEFIKRRTTLQDHQRTTYRTVSRNGKFTGISMLNSNQTILEKMFHSLFISVMINTASVWIHFASFIDILCSFKLLLFVEKYIFSCYSGNIHFLWYAWSNNKQ